MKNFLYKINREFELRFGWIFVNGQKTERWQQYLINKYGEK